MESNQILRTQHQRAFLAEGGRQGLVGQVESERQVLLAHELYVDVVVAGVQQVCEVRNLDGALFAFVEVSALDDVAVDAHDQVAVGLCGPGRLGVLHQRLEREDGGLVPNPNGVASCPTSGSMERTEPLQGTICVLDSILRVAPNGATLGYGT